MSRQPAIAVLLCRALAGPLAVAGLLLALTSSVPAAPAQAAVSRALTFGIYPGGVAGTVGRSGPTKPEDSAKRLRALNGLRGHARHFVLHLYTSWDGSGRYDPLDAVAADIRDYTSHRYLIEL